LNVLLMYYGTPYDESQIEPYYTDIRKGRKPSDELLRELKKRYGTIAKSPFNEVSFSLARRLEAELNLRIPRFPKGLQKAPKPRPNDADARVYLGGKHNAPFIADALQQMLADGAERAVALATTPHYSLRSIAEYEAAVQEALSQLGDSFPIVFIKEYYDHPAYIGAVARRLAAALWRTSAPQKAMVFFTAHSIPLRAAAADGGAYGEQIETSARMVASRLGIENWRVAWQSAGRSNEEWLGPDINDALRQAADDGYKEAVLSAIGFTADHLEILYDLDYEARQTAQECGIHLVRAQSLNDDYDYVRLLADLAEAAWYAEAK